VESEHSLKEDEMIKEAPLEETPEWKDLYNHCSEVRDLHLRELFARDPDRFERFSLVFEGMLIDFSKNNITNETLGLLIRLARASEVEKARDAMFNGKPINWTENRPVLHAALRNRSGEPVIIDGQDVMPGIQSSLEKVKEFSDRVRSGKWKGATGKSIRTVIHVGTGGSSLGPVMITEALYPYSEGGVSVRFVSNVDASDFHKNTKDLNPEETLFVIASKSFATQETVTIHSSAKRWLLRGLGSGEGLENHFVALTSRKELATASGIDQDNILEFWDWVGGRYSWASAIGLPIACNIGHENFVEVLEGAHAMDRHFKEAPLEENIPVILALLGIWYNDFFGAASHAIIPYDKYLHRFTAYFQQADMESNGKQVDRDGNKVGYQTGPIVWGEPGTDVQHSFFQLLHQGTKLVPADFIGCVNSQNKIGDHHEKLMANFFAQSEALMSGRSEEEAKAELIVDGMEAEEADRLLPHKVFEGNRPTNTILINKLTPRALGSLIAMYEMKIFVQGAIWRINSFDQWGVELGKVLAKTILAEEYDLIAGKKVDLANHDSSTRGLLNHFMAKRDA